MTVDSDVKKYIILIAISYDNISFLLQRSKGDDGGGIIIIINNNLVFVS